MYSRNRSAALDSQPPEPEVSQLGRPLLCALGVVMLIFCLSEVVEWKWLADMDLGQRHLLHAARGIFSSLLVALVVGWMVVKRSPPLLPVSPIAGEWPGPRRLGTGERIRMYARWFIAMRWIAVLVAGGLVFISVVVARLLPEEVLWPLAGTIATLALCNLVYGYVLRWEAGGRMVLLLQGYIDLGILVVLLHFSGGVENPLSTVMILHVIIGGILLSRGQCYGIAAVGSLLFGFLIWGEYTHALDHYTLKVFPHDLQHGGSLIHAAHQPLFALSRATLQSALLFLTGYFVTTLAERMRANESRLEAMAERALADRQLLERSLETTGAGLRVLSRDLDTYWVSNRWREWFSCGTTETCSICKLLDGAASPAGECLRNGQVRVTDIVVDSNNCPVLCRRQGVSQRIFQVTTAPLVDTAGQIGQVVELAQDITQQKQTQVQMIRAGKLAAVGELAGQIVHEINNPISIISAKASLLLSDRRNEMSPKLVEEIGKIEELAKRVARIAQGLLSYSRPAAGRHARLDPRVPIRQSLAMVEEHARRKNVLLEDLLPGHMPDVKANRQELEQVFLNLFLNALDAMPQGGSLRILAPPGRAELAQHTPAVNIAVEDTGCGIPAENLDKVFEPFFTTKKEGRGTGLGLSICLGLVRSHGGTMAIDSQIGRGTRITVTLPLETSPIEKEAAHG